MAQSEGNSFPNDLQLLQAIRHDLATRVAPELSSDMAKDICRMTVDILDRLYSRQTVDAALLHNRVTDKANLVERGIALLTEAGQTFDGAMTSIPAGGDIRAFARAQDSLLVRLIPRLMILADEQPARAASVKPLLAALVEGDDAQQASSSASAVEAAARFTEERTASEAKVTQDQLQAYLRRHFPDNADLIVSSMRELPGGFGKTTILFDVAGAPAGLPGSMVMRRDRSAGATEATVIDEFPLLKAVQGHGLPAPQPLWLEPDAGQLGLPFLVVDRLPGQQAGSLWAPDPALCTRETALDLARIIARLHAIPIASVGSTGVWAPEARADAIAESINYITDLWTRTQMEPDPVMDMCLQWLKLHQPPAPEHPVLVHSDIGFHNLLVKDEKISGLLDWELAHPGDANEDLCYVRPYIEQLMPWDEFVAEYLAHGGHAYKEDRTDYYAIWRDVRNAIFTGLCHRGFCTDANTDIRFGHAGMMYMKMMLQSAANRILSL